MIQDSQEPCYFVIFGATGNLMMTKLLPALYRLEEAGRLAEGLRFVAFARREWTDAMWGEEMRRALAERVGDRFEEAVFKRFAARFTYLRGDLRDDEAYVRLKAGLRQPESGDGGRTVFYLSIKPGDFGDVVTRLSAVGLGRAGQHRIVVEKPFGEDLDSARQLNNLLHQHFDEEQIYRIDHYLGKETVQNLLVFRFANTLIEPIWNRNYIDHVQITVAESDGISTRAGYYDQTGALRDMLQNHLMQLLTAVAMEPPAILEADALRDEKVKVLRSIRAIPRESVNAYAYRAQYAGGHSEGRNVAGYAQEAGVARGSATETFVAAKFYIDNWRWRHVPFYLRTGKRLARNQSLIAIRFKHPPQQLFRETPVEHIAPNWVLLSIQPDECMHVELHAKQPGLGMETRVVRLNASYRAPDERRLDAYETLLLDVIEGDRSLFIRFDEVEWAWRVVDPIMRVWARDQDYVATYPAGSWGPRGAERLFDAEDQQWRNEL
ncbi:MAG: glucose-6-phosphate dehydrogenase [Thiotrichales bacterium]